MSTGMLGRLPAADAVVPAHRFSEAVQINDQGQTIAQRQMNAEGTLGVVTLGLPLIPTELVPYALTYAEIWETSETLPTQVAIGDMNVSAAGLEWGNPLFLDFQFGADRAGPVCHRLCGTCGVHVAAAGLAGQSHLGQRLLHACRSRLDRSPGGRQGAAGDYRNVAVAALGYHYKNDFTALYPDAVTINNQGQTAFPAELSSKHGRGDNLITGPHDGQTRLLGITTTDFIASPKIADNGYSVLAGGNGLYSVSFDLDAATQSAVLPRWATIRRSATRGT